MGWDWCDPGHSWPPHPGYIAGWWIAYVVSKYSICLVVENMGQAARSSCNACLKESIKVGSPNRLISVCADYTDRKSL